MKIPLSPHFPVDEGWKSKESIYIRKNCIRKDDVGKSTGSYDFRVIFMSFPLQGVACDIGGDDVTVLSDPE